MLKNNQSMSNAQSKPIIEHVNNYDNDNVITNTAKPKTRRNGSTSIHTQTCNGHIKHNPNKSAATSIPLEKSITDITESFDNFIAMRTHMKIINKQLKYLGDNFNKLADNHNKKVKNMYGDDNENGSISHNKAESITVKKLSRGSLLCECGYRDKLNSPANFSVIDDSDLIKLDNTFEKLFYEAIVKLPDICDNESPKQTQQKQQKQQDHIVDHRNINIHPIQIPSQIIPHPPQNELIKLKTSIPYTGFRKII